MKARERPPAECQIISFKPLEAISIKMMAPLKNTLFSIVLPLLLAPSFRCLTVLQVHLFVIVFHLLLLPHTTAIHIPHLPLHVVSSQGTVWAHSALSKLTYILNGISESHFQVHALCDTTHCPWGRSP